MISTFFIGGPVKVGSCQLWTSVVLLEQAEINSVIAASGR